MKQTKKLLSFIITICLALGISACSFAGDGPVAPETAAGAVETQASAAETPADAAKTPASAPAVLVAYFSATGTTKRVAEDIAALTNADVYEIIPAAPYTDSDLNYSDSQSRASTEMTNPEARPEIGSPAISLEGYSTVYLGYPIWWGDAPRIMSTFVEAYDFDGLTIIPFCTSGSSGIGRSGSNLAEQAKGGNWLNGRRFSQDVSTAELQAWIGQQQ